MMLSAFDLRRVIAVTALTLLASWPGAAIGSSDVTDYFDGWFDRVDRTQAEQPRWMTPLVTVTPLLEEEFRWDAYRETLPHDAGTIDSFGAGKGLELIPTEQTEIIVGVPPYMVRSGRGPHEGLGDMPFLLKYRLFTENAADGDYIVTAFLQGSAPMGDRSFSSHHYAIGPTLAIGKGWGDFDIQATLGESFPTGAAEKLGRPIALNTAFQYHWKEFFWPQFEVNYTYWPDGQKEGKSQIYLTPGVILGRFPIAGRLRLAVGFGYQFAVSPETPAYDNNWILSIRTPF